MGVAATKVVCSELSRACADAERNGKSRFDPDLICQSDAFVKAAKALLKQLPVQLKARPSRTLLASERSNTIHLPEELEAEFRKWRQDPQSFHLSLAERISSPVTVTRLQIPPIAEVYIRCSEADCAATLENVRLRFYCVIFYDLKEEITPNQPLTSEILNLITAAIGNTGAVDGFNETKTREKIKEWIKAGAKFSSLAKDLNGRGALFFTTLSKSHVLHHFPESRDHPDRKELISSLLKRGIAREATKLNANDVADKVIAHHLGPLRATLVEGIRKGLSEVHPASRRKKTPPRNTQPDADSPSSGLGNKSSSGIDNEEVLYEEGSVADLDYDRSSVGTAPIERAQTPLDDGTGTCQSRPGIPSSVDNSRQSVPGNTHTSRKRRQLNQTDFSASSPFDTPGSPYHDEVRSVIGDWNNHTFEMSPVPGSLANGHRNSHRPLGDFDLSLSHETSHGADRGRSLYHQNSQEIYPCVGTDWIDSRPAVLHFLNSMPGSGILDGVFPDTGSTTLQALAQSRPTQITNNESPENGLYQVASTNVHVPSQTQQGQRRINDSSLQSGPIYSPSRLRMDNFPYMTDGYMTNGFTQPIRPFAESGPSSLFHGHSPDTVPYLQLGYDLRGFDFQGP